MPELVGDPETLIVDSTLLSVLHPRQVNQLAGFDGAAWVRWGSFSVYGVKLHLLCATNRVPVCYELTAANVAGIRLVGELLGEAGLGEDLARRLLGGLAYRSKQWGDELAEVGIALVTERSRQAPADRGGVLCPQANLRNRAHAGQDVGQFGHQDCGEDSCLHLCFLRQPPAGKAARPAEGSVGMKTLQHSSSGLPR